MKTIRWIMVLAAFLLAVISWRADGSRRETSLHLASLEQKRAEALDQIQRLHSTITAAEKDEDELRLALERVKVAHGTGSIPPSKASSGAPLTPMDAIARDPELQAKYLATRRRTFLTTYGPLMRRLGLTPDLASRFYDQLMGFEGASQDIVMAAQIQGLAPDDPSLVKLKQEAWSHLKTAQTDLLGPAKAEDVRQFDRTLGARAIVNTFVGIAAYSGTPLSPGQADQMTQAIAAANAKYQKGGDSDPTQVDWALADVRLRALLTPAQLILFQQSETLTGASRWTSSLNRAIAEAKAADRNPRTDVR